MNEIYFVDDLENSNTIFVKKNVGALVTGEEHDFGLLCEYCDAWAFEPIPTFRWLNPSDLMTITAKLIQLNNDVPLTDNLMPVGFVFVEVNEETASSGGTHIAFGSGCFSELSHAAASEIEQRMLNFFDDGVDE